MNDQGELLPDAEPKQIFPTADLSVLNHAKQLAWEYAPEAVMLLVYWIAVPIRSNSEGCPRGRCSAS